MEHKNSYFLQKHPLAASVYDHISLSDYDCTDCHSKAKPFSSDFFRGSIFKQRMINLREPQDSRSA